MNGMRRAGLAVLGVVVAVAAAPRPVEAGGFEYPAAGARALGRGGAFFARADDPMALAYNPAGLAFLSGSQLMLTANIGFFDACYDRDGTYGENLTGNDMSRFGESDFYFASEFQEVCNEGPPSPGGAGLVFTHRLNEQLGLGFGVVAPAAAGHLVWGDVDDDGTVPYPGSPTGELPAPSRYQLVESQLLILYPSVGVGWSPTPQMSFGATLQWGIGVFNFTNVTRATGGEGPSTDIYTELEAADFFIPRVIVSAHFVPHDNIDITLGALISDNVRGTGTLGLDYGRYGNGMDGSTQSSPNTIEDVRLDAPQPWQFHAGIRYADRITSRPRDVGAVERLSNRVEDPMSNERWDVELDFVYEVNSRVDELVVTPPADATIMATDVIGGMPFTNTLPLPDRIGLPHNWKDQWSLRLGGDYNIIPGMAAVRLGFSYESDGVDPRYQSLDFFPTERIGVHAGLTVRLGRIDISLAYAHLFQSDIEVAPNDGAAGGPENEAMLPQVSADGMGVIVNAGTYSSNFDVLALSANYHF